MYNEKLIENTESKKKDIRNIRQKKTCYRINPSVKCTQIKQRMRLTHIKITVCKEHNVKPVSLFFVNEKKKK